MISSRLLRAVPALAVALAFAACERGFGDAAEPQLVVEVMHNFLVCDPCMKHSDTSSPLYKPCLEIWRRYISKEPEELAATAAQMRAYFK